MVKTKSKSSDRTSISYKLTRAIFVASSIIAFIVSSVLFFFDYRRDKLQIDTLYQAGRSGAVNSLLAAITKNDFLQIQLQTDGLVLLPGIEYARIVDQSGDVLASSGLEEKNLTGITWIRWEITGAIGGKVQTLGKILLAQDTDFLLIRMAEKAGIFYFGQFVKTILTLWIFMYLIRIHVVSHLKFIAEYFESSDGLGISGDKRLVLNRKFSNDELQFLVEIINKMHRLIWHRYADQRQRVLNLDKELQNNARESVSGASITALSELAGGVAHQVNNPLTILEGSLIVAERMIGDSSRDAKKILELLNSSRKSVNRIAHVTRQLLKFSSQGLPEKFVDSTVNDVFLKINSALESVERATGLTVEFPSSDKTDNIDIVCSPDQVAQAIVALIKNSMEAIESSEVRWIQVEFMVREMFFEFSVTDSGIGLVGESETRVFLPFYTTKVATSNLGLGLTLAQGVAQAHRGKITIDRTSVTSKVRISLSRKLVSSTLTSDIERAA